MALDSQLQTYQIFTNDDQKLIFSLFYSITTVFDFKLEIKGTLKRKNYLLRTWERTVFSSINANR